jgi:hypothetical protein
LLGYFLEKGITQHVSSNSEHSAAAAVAAAAAAATVVAATFGDTTAHLTFR